MKKERLSSGTAGSDLLKRAAGCAERLKSPFSSLSCGYERDGWRSAHPGSTAATREPQAFRKTALPDRLIRADPDLRPAISIPATVAFARTERRSHARAAIVPSRSQTPTKQETRKATKTPLQ